MTDANRRLNELRREVQRANERLKNLELDVEPGGHISQGFEVLSRDIDELGSEVRRNHQQFSHQINQLSHQINRVLARQEVMLEAFTKISDLPEE